MSLSQKILNIKRKRHDGNYAWGHADALSEAAALAKTADETIAVLKAIITAWEADEIGQIDGSLIDQAAEAVAKVEGVV